LKSDDFPFDTFSLKSSENETISVVKGDLYSILKRCISASYNEKGSPLDEASKSAIIDAAQKLAALGLEIEAYALCAKDGFSLDSTHLAHKRLSFLGFVAYSKGLSPKCEELFTLCEGKGIEPIIIHNGTKEELGLLLSGSGYLKRLSYVDCNTLGEDEATLRTALSSYNVYLNPSEKQLDVIIKIISKNDIKSAYISRQNGNAPFVLKYASEICKNETENEIVFTDQTPDLFALLCSSYDLKRRFSLVLRFLAFLSLSRISMSTLSLFFGVSVLSPLSASILTFAIDAFSLFVLLSDRLEKASDEDAVTASLLSLKSLASILALPFIILMSATAMKLFYSQDTATIVTALCFYSQTLLAPLYMLFVLKVRLSERLLAYLLGILIFISLISMFSPFGNLLRVISDVKLLFASLLLTLIFLLFYRKITKNN
jgi:hypothetical protein